MASRIVALNRPAELLVVPSRLSSPVNVQSAGSVSAVKLKWVPSSAPDVMGPLRSVSSPLQRRVPFSVPVSWAPDSAISEGPVCGALVKPVGEIEIRLKWGSRQGKREWYPDHRRRTRKGGQAQRPTVDA